MQHSAQQPLGSTEASRTAIPRASISATTSSITDCVSRDSFSTSRSVWTIPLSSTPPRVPRRLSRRLDNAATGSHTDTVTSRFSHPPLTVSGDLQPMVRSVPEPVVDGYLALLTDAVGTPATVLPTVNRSQAARHAPSRSGPPSTPTTSAPTRTQTGRRSVDTGQVVAGMPSTELVTPAAVQAVANGRRVRPVWENELGGITFEVGTDPQRCFVKWTPPTSGINLSHEVVRLSWAWPSHRCPDCSAKEPMRRGPGL